MKTEKMVKFRGRATLCSWTVVPLRFWISFVEMVGVEAGGRRVPARFEIRLPLRGTNVRDGKIATSSRNRELGGRHVTEAGSYIFSSVLPGFRGASLTSQTQLASYSLSRKGRLSVIGRSFFFFLVAIRETRCSGSAKFGLGTSPGEVPTVFRRHIIRKFPAALWQGGGDKWRNVTGCEVRVAK